MSTRKPHSKPARFLLVANINSPYVSLESSRWGVSLGTRVKQIFLFTVSKELNNTNRKPFEGKTKVLCLFGIGKVNM